jgi:proteic killer suppression protein
VIVSFADADTEALAAGFFIEKFQSVEKIARRKIRQLDIAEKLNDLLIPPGNRLEYLKGNRRGQFSIRINDQWRICFEWSAKGAENVEIVDYH